MADSDLIERALADRAKLAQVIRRRPRVAPVAAVVMSLLFALTGASVVMLDSLLIHSESVTFEEGETAPITLRVPHFTGLSEHGIKLSGGAILIARGDTVDAVQAHAARALMHRTPGGLTAFAAYFSGLFLIGLLYTTHLRRSNRGRLLRTQAVTLLLLVGGALAFKLVLMLTPVSALIVPVAGAALVATLVVDVSAGLATALVASILVGMLVPFDLGVLGILGIHSSVAVMVVGERYHKNRHVALAGLLGGLAAAISYVVLYYLIAHASAVSELGSPLRSSLIAAALGGLASAAVALPAKPVYQWLLGDITRNKLVELEDLSNPLLRQIAENAPGTWQHSLAMANMAEIAANTIGANGRLVRVGAYYHDLGKSLQPKYFIENLEPGESSPHDRLPPEVSCDAIFAHVTEGIRVARKMGLPERIIDFMHMHHGDGLLEYFWGKCQEMGNPKHLKPDDFRYPGVPPQSRETAILAICDAVEAASRTLKNPDERAISNLVQRIVYGKLHLGQLDESGLSMADLRKISNSLRETIKHASHGRIEYPWQREERAARALEAAASVSSAVPTPLPVAASSSTQRIIAEPRLDSLDVPRPYWRESRASSTSGLYPSVVASPVASIKRRTFETAVTEPILPASAASSAAMPAASTPALPAASSNGAGSRHGDPAKPPMIPPPRQAPATARPDAPAGWPPTDKDIFFTGDDQHEPVIELTPKAAPAAAEPASLRRPLLPPQRDSGELGGDEETMVGADLGIMSRAKRLPPPPPPGSPERQQRGTIELMKDPPSSASRQGSSGKSGDPLMPGTMIIGPPPATRPSRQITVQAPAEDPPSASAAGPVTVAPKRRPLAKPSE